MRYVAVVLVLVLVGCGRTHECSSSDANSDLTPFVEPTERPDLRHDAGFDMNCLGQPCGSGIDCDVAHGWACCASNGQIVNCRGIGETCEASADCWPDLERPGFACEGGRCCYPLMTGPCQRNADCCEGTCQGTVCRP